MILNNDIQYLVEFCIKFEKICMHSRYWELFVVLRRKICIYYWSNIEWFSNVKVFFNCGNQGLIKVAHQKIIKNFYIWIDSPSNGLKNLLNQYCFYLFINRMKFTVIHNKTYLIFLHCFFNKVKKHRNFLMELLQKILTKEDFPPICIFPKLFSVWYH